MYNVLLSVTVSLTSSRSYRSPRSFTSRRKPSSINLPSQRRTSSNHPCALSASRSVDHSSYSRVIVAQRGTNDDVLQRNRSVRFLVAFNSIINRGRSEVRQTRVTSVNSWLELPILVRKPAGPLPVDHRPTDDRNASACERMISASTE